MPPKTTRTGGNKKPGEKRKTSLRSSQKDCGTSADPIDVTNSQADEAETTSKPDKTDIMLQTGDQPSQVFEPERVPSTSAKADTSHQGHQSQQYASDEETRVAAETLELL